MFDWMQNIWQTLAQVAPVSNALAVADSAQPPEPASVADALPNAADPNAALSAPDALGQALPEIDTTGVESPAEALQSLVDVGSQNGMLDFIQQSDWVGQGLFVILMVMSLASWYLILYKWIMNWRTKRRTERFLRTFWAAGSLAQVEDEITARGAREPFAHLASHAMHARSHHAAYGASKLEEAGSTSAFVTRTIRKCIDEETSRLENGLTVLASVGSTAPFVGLFGTVWGVYHALIGIGLADGVTVNRIAGPVGEALIMTGLGLAVAIPAVLAYNFFVRSNRVYLGRLDAFAHDLFTFLTTGQQQANGRNVKGRRTQSSLQAGD